MVSGTESIRIEYFNFYPNDSPLLGPPSVLDGKKDRVRDENKAWNIEEITMFHVSK